MQAAARLAQATGRAALPVVGAGVAATVTSGPAHADAHATSADLPCRRIVDEWELADLKDKSLVLFTPADIDDAVNLLATPGSALVEDLDSSDSSDGTVDEIIERHSYFVTEPTVNSIGVDADVLKVAARLLKSPGVQREIIEAALSDPEVLDIMAGKMDLPGYLEAQGFAARGLLPPCTSSGAGTSSSRMPSRPGTARQAAAARSTDGPQADSTNIFEEVSTLVADSVESLGLAVVRLGRWMRSKLLGAQEGASSATTEDAHGDTKGPSKVPVRDYLIAVGVAMVAIAAVLLLKRCL